MYYALPSIAGILVGAWSATSCAQCIQSPQNNALYNYVAARNYANIGTIFYESQDINATTNWTVSVVYSPSASGPTFTGTPATFTTTPNYGVSVDAFAEGGMFTVQAQETANGSCAGSSTYYVDGAAIPTTVIYPYANAQYASAVPGAATPSLFEGIVVTESSNQQFVQSTLYGQSGYWPNWNKNNYQFVGLTMSMYNDADVWDWAANVNEGVRLFAAFYKQAQHFDNLSVKQYKGLAASTSMMLENNALVVYGGWAKGYEKNIRAAYYFVPSCVGGKTLNRFICKGGTWQWAKNKVNTSGTSYTDTVRANIP